MHNDMILLKKIAGNGLCVCRKFEKEDHGVYSRFVVGKGGFAIPQRNSVTGKLEHSNWAVMETIYDDYGAHPELKINEKLWEVLEEALRNEQDAEYLTNAIECLLHQMRGEKQHTVPFTLDCETLLDALRENIRVNRVEHILNEMMPRLEDYDKIFTESYGVSIM